MEPEQQGIEVDDAAAYFGATSSSEGLHAMLSMPREDALVAFFRQLSDLVLQPGDFDFEAAGARMACEGGELYYLVAGHLGLMSMADPLLQHLGAPDSTGESHAATSSLHGAAAEPLLRLADPMRILRLLAIAQETGGEDEVRRYLAGLEQRFANPAVNEDDLLRLASEVDASLDVAGQVIPVPMLADANANAVALEVRPTELPVISPVQTLAPSPTPVPESTPVPLPPSSTPSIDEAVPLPPSPAPSSGGAVPLPPAAAEPSRPVEERPLDDRRMDAAAADAFAGAFGSSLSAEEEGPLPLEERFELADDDGSGGLSVEELAEATGTDLEEAARLHAAADADGDGQVTIEEFAGSEAAVKAASLPRPVRAAPVRAPVTQAAPAQQPMQQTPPQPQQAWPQQPTSVQHGSWPQQQQQTLGGLAGQQRGAWPQQQGWGQAMPQQGWGQPQQGWTPQPMHNVPPTIPSGIRCPGCGIGIDGQWRFCPVCGSRNPAMPY